MWAAKETSSRPPASPCCQGLPSERARRPRRRPRTRLQTGRGPRGEALRLHSNYHQLLFSPPPPPPFKRTCLLSPVKISLTNSQLIQQTRRGPWSAAEDADLLRLIEEHGPNNWVRLSQLLGTRTAKQCRERFHQNLKPSLNHTPITDEEGAYIEQLVLTHGKKWADIARRLNGRSDNAVKNWWNGGASRRRRASLASRPSPSGSPSLKTSSSSSSSPHNAPFGMNSSPSLSAPNGQPHELGPNHYYSAPYGNNQQQFSLPAPSLPLPPPSSQYPNFPPQHSSSFSSNDYSQKQQQQQQQQPSGIFNPNFSMSQSSSTSSSSNTSSYDPSIIGQQATESTKITQDVHQYPYHTHLTPAPRQSHHRVSMPNIHSYAPYGNPSHTPHTPSPFSTNIPQSSSPLKPPFPTDAPSPSRPLSSGIVFNSAYTSDSSGFRKSSSVSLTGHGVDPHQESPHGPASDPNAPAWSSQNNATTTANSAASLYPLLSAGPSPPNGGPRFPNQHTRSASVYQHPSSVRKRAMGLATSSPADELYANTPYTRRFSATALSSANLNSSSRTSSIDGSVTNSSDNEDPLSGSIHSLSKYSLTGSSTSRRNSHVVPMPPPEVNLPSAGNTAPSSAGSSSSSSASSSLSSTSTAASSASTTPTQASSLKPPSAHLPPVSTFSSGFTGTTAKPPPSPTTAYSRSPPPPTFLTQPAASAMAGLYQSGQLQAPGSPLGLNSNKGPLQLPHSYDHNNQQQLLPPSSSALSSLAPAFQHRHSISGYPSTHQASGVGLGLVDKQGKGHAGAALVDAAAPTSSDNKSDSSRPAASGGGGGVVFKTPFGSQNNEPKPNFKGPNYFQKPGQGDSSSKDTEMVDPHRESFDPRDPSNNGSGSGYIINNIGMVAAAAAASEKLPVAPAASSAGKPDGPSPKPNTALEESEDKKLKIASLLS